MEITDDSLVHVSRLHQVSILELFSERYLIDLVPIPLRESNIIVGMDWLSHIVEMFDYEH